MVAPERTMGRDQEWKIEHRLERRCKTAGERVRGAEEARSRCQE